MPKLNKRTGLSACGTAGGRVSVGGSFGEQRVLCDGGCTFWLNDDHIAYMGPEHGSWNGTPGRVLPMKVNVHTGVFEPLSTREGNFFAAGGDRWQVGIAGPGGYFGSCGESPVGSLSRAMTDGRGAASDDGTIALIDLYQGENNGFRLGLPNGAIYPPPKDANGNRLPSIADGEDPYTLHVIDKGRAIWTRRTSFGLHGIAVAPAWIKNTAGRACWCEAGGVVHLVHWIEGIGLVARRADSKRGKVLANAGQEFHHDAIPWAGGVRVCWATVDGEPPGSLRVVDWDGVSDVVDLEEPPTPIVIPTFSFNHPVSTVVFKDPEGVTAAPAELLVNLNEQKTSRPVFVADDSFIDGHVRGPLLGIYTEAKGDKLPAAIAMAAKAKTRLLVCHDTQDAWTLPSGLRAWDIPAIEMYRYPNETLLVASRRWLRDAKAMLQQWPGDCAVVSMFYCMGGAAGGNPPEVWPVADVLATQPYLNDVVNLSTRIKLVMPFSYLRANGIVAHEELQLAYGNLLQAAPHPPSLLPVEPTQPTTPYPAARPYATRTT